MAPASRGQDVPDRPHIRVNGNSLVPPPSTMAAQLINTISTPNKPSRQTEQEDLKKLMDEVSYQEASIANFSNAKTKLKHKHKLIYVFARAVLERLAGDDPFLDFQKIVPQASDALDIFMSTIKEAPDVLICCSGPEYTLPGRGQEPLWFWLFPRVLALLGRRQCESLTEKIKEFFYGCFQVVARVPNLWDLSTFFFCYFKECTTTILNHLQTPRVEPQNHMIDAWLPAGELDQSMFSNDFDESSSNTVPNCIYLIRFGSEGVSHVANILCMLVDISMTTAASYNATPAFQDYMGWMLESFLSTYEQRRRLQYDVSIYNACSKFDITSFCSLQAMLSTTEASLSPSMMKKGYTVLSILCSDIIEKDKELLDKAILLSLCKCLLNLVAICKGYYSMHRVVFRNLVPAIQVTLNDESRSTNLGKDFMKAAVILLQEVGAEIPKTTSLHMAGSFDSVDLDDEMTRMDLDFMEQKMTLEAPLNKRRKIDVELDLLGEVTTKLYSLLGSQDAMDLDGSDQFAQDCFAELSDADRLTAFEYLGMLPCVANGTLTVTRGADGKISSSTCFFCDGKQPASSIKLDTAKCQTVSADAIATFVKITKSTAFTGRPRVLAMVTLKRFTAHFHNTDFMDLMTSTLGQWCVASLNSSTRELRIAAGRTLTGFLSSTAISDESIYRNREMVLDLLRSISDQDKVHLQETWILTWGQIGRILHDDGLGLVLLKMVEFLGHPNPLVSAVAFNEIIKLANAKELTPERMFNPFWDDVAIAAVKDLLVRPQTTQLMADILGTSVPEFLLLTQSSTLPHLVLSGRIDVIGKITQARGDDENLKTCMEPSNFASILALLIVQPIPDIEALTTSVLRAVSPLFKEQDMDFTDWMRSDPAVLGLRLLRVAGQVPDSMKSRIHMAFRMLATYAPPGSQKTGDPIGAFISHHILGFMARFSEVVNDVWNQYSMIEKTRCIKGLEEMVKIGKKAIKAARPQVCACLQAALAQKELQSDAFSAWEKMLHNLEDEDVETMLENTFSTVIQRWETFNEVTRRRAEATFQYLLKHRTRLIRNMIVNLPSLSQFPELDFVEKTLNKFRTPTDVGNAFAIFSRRVRHENSGVVAQALIELRAYLRLHHSFLQASAVSEQPDTVVGVLVRSILDACITFNEAHSDIAQLSADCIGLIGCLDSNRVESVREQSEMVVVSNFHDAGETTDFVLHMLKEVIVKAFLSTTDTGVQGFLSLVMQNLLLLCNFREVCTPFIMKGERRNTENDIFRKWLALPGSVQETLTPFLTSKFSVTEIYRPKLEYPLFCPAAVRFDKIYNSWLKNFVFDLLHKPSSGFAEVIFPPLRRAIKIRNISIASFLLPYVVLHVVVEGTNQDREEIVNELLAVLNYRPTVDFKIQEEDLKLCSEAVFQVLDYLSRWIRAKQIEASKIRGPTTAEENIALVRSVLDLIPAELVSQRSIECRSYSRALFYWEQHIRQVRDRTKELKTVDVLQLQDIYTQIDEPDGIEGISAYLHVLDIDQQILGHRKAGRWTAAQSWYEIKLAETPDDVEVQVNLLTCLKESGQHDVLLNYVEGMQTSTKTVSKLLPFATEASWVTGRWKALEKYTKLATGDTGEDFNIKIGRALLALHKNETEQFKLSVLSLREQIACSLSMATTPSLSACRDDMLKFHVLTELEMIAGADGTGVGRERVLESLNRRLEVVGAYLNDKQYLLGIRRAAMQLSSLNFTNLDRADAWLTSARLARKGNAIHQAFNAVLHASQLGDKSATIEHARLLMKEGHHRKAIQSLEGAIASGAFITHNKGPEVTSFTGVNLAEQQNLLMARAHLLLAKWLDSAGQTHSGALRSQYQLAAKTHNDWEKGHYYLGRHYNKLLESEKSLAPELQAEAYLTGEMARLVIENYLRSLLHGTKYIYQTLPRILTLWLDLGTQVNQPLDAKFGTAKEFVQRIVSGRREQLGALHGRFNKYIQKLPAYMFYTALPQIVARINHPNPDVSKYLIQMIIKVVSKHPQQAMWSILAVATSMQSDRKARGVTILQQLRNSSKRPEAGELDVKMLIKNGERLTSALLEVCVAGEFQGNRTTKASITKDLHFNQKLCTPNLLAVPIEKVLTATLPTLTDSTKTHQAFSRDVVTIDSFSDEVLILSSLQKPRKLMARGSDGKDYGLLCKPKDDLRKDQRLMEFNSMINRSLKRDAESSRRQLYIKTYAVTPLNEECGIIEWVDGLKTLRDILIGLYRPLGIAPDYREIERFCEEALKGPSDDKMTFFTEKVLGQFPPIFHQWFVQQFPEPSAWFAARLRYTRSCAVMSMVGTILGLGDRHGENILFEEGNGGTFHVDFNCLFDKGLTFVKPERVPFRLTHNMVDAMGIYGYEGPFRKSSELTLKLLRQHEETLMTILEAFVYDPTLDLVKKDHKKKKEGSAAGPQTAQGVLDTIQRKVRGLLQGESVPLGVEGQVDELIKQATDLKYLAGMYIGWCSFF